MRSARYQRVKSPAQPTAALKQRSTQPELASRHPVTREPAPSNSDRRSASDLESALARRRAWIGNSSSATDAGAYREAGPEREGEMPSIRDDGTTTDGGEGVTPPAELSPLERQKASAIREAMAARGTRYRWGGASRGGFDCSGFTRYIMARNLGIQLPHSASAQSRYGQKVAFEDLQEGDLVFFRTYRRGISHVGIYIGDNRFIHAPRSGRSVAVDTLTGYYRRRFATARRLAGSGTPG